MLKHIKQYATKIIKDSHGNVVIGQRPNAILIIWATLALARLLVPASHSLHQGLGWATLLAGLIWSGLELTLGVNLFRRLLGGLIMIFLLSRFFT